MLRAMGSQAGVTWKLRNLGHFLESTGYFHRNVS